MAARASTARLFHALRQTPSRRLVLPASAATTHLSAVRATAEEASAASSAVTQVSRNALLATARPFSVSARDQDKFDKGEGRDEGAEGVKPRKRGLVRSLLHGSEGAQAEGLLTHESHSKTVGRGKYIHEIQKHKVHADKVDEYKAVIADYYPRLAAVPEYNLHHTGSWHVQVGEMDTFYHIWEYQGYAGYDRTTDLINRAPDRKEFLAKLVPLIESRSSDMIQEFAFWASSPPRETGGIYELRQYELIPGKLLEWESHWRRGLEARRQFVEPIGAWFTQIGRLHTVYHIWAYPSLEARKTTRDQAWQVDTWSDTVSQTVKLVQKMNAQIMVPLPFSPLK